MESLNQALQVFAKLHPEFDHFWQTELDVRYTGHWYNLLENADSVRTDTQVHYLSASLFEAEGVLGEYDTSTAN